MTGLNSFTPQEFSKFYLLYQVIRYSKPFGVIIVCDQFVFVRFSDKVNFFNLLSVT